MMTIQQHRRWTTYKQQQLTTEEEVTRVVNLRSSRVNLHALIGVRFEIPPSFSTVSPGPAGGTAVSTVKNPYDPDF